MDKERIAIGYRALEPATSQHFSLRDWQYHPNGLSHLAHTVEEMHKHCGTLACAAGYLALSPEFKALGGSRAISGRPIFEKPFLDAPRTFGAPGALQRFYKVYPGDESAVINRIHGLSILDKDTTDFYGGRPLPPSNSANGPRKICHSIFYSLRVWWIR